MWPRLSNLKYHVMHLIERLDRVKEALKVARQRINVIKDSSSSREVVVVKEVKVALTALAALVA